MKLSVIFDAIGSIVAANYFWEIIKLQFPSTQWQWFQWVAFLILYCMAFFFALVIASNYLCEVDKISHKNKLLLRLRYAITSIALCGMFALYKIEMFNKHTILYWLVGIFSVWSFFWGPNCFGRIAEKFAINGQERDIFIPVNNPKTQSDIWPFHVTMIGLLLMPWIAELFH